MGAAILSCHEDVFARVIILENAELALLGQEVLSRVPDYNRISAQIVSGIGFLGAGMIIQNRGKLHGITYCCNSLGYGLSWNSYRFRAMGAFYYRLHLYIFKYFNIQILYIRTIFQIKKGL